MHSENIKVQPIVRLQKICFKNFMNIHESEIIINNERKNNPKDTDSSILGIYGQNGSGKTAVIKALAILRLALRGWKINNEYADCIAYGQKYAELSFVFDFDYDAELSYNRTISYSFKLASIHNTETDELPYFRYKRRPEIVNERITASGLFNGVIQKKQDILTMDTGKYPIGPVRKINEFLGENKEAVKSILKQNRLAALKEGTSFFFSDKMIDLFEKHSNNSEYFQVLSDLQNFAQKKLFVIDISLGEKGYIIINTQSWPMMITLIGTWDGKMEIKPEIYDKLELYFKEINEVLPAIIPDLQINLKRKATGIGKKKRYKVDLFSKRSNDIMPLRFESAGVLKLISVLSLLVAVYNDPAVTVAIDELDAGIYEYLLGEILMGLEKYGKGQLIFTSHNLRPLEVLKKESLVFTTTNPDNRFIRLKGVGKTNNLRSLYLREILADSQDEKIYDAAKRQRMIASFIKAGEIAKKIDYSLDIAGNNDD